MCSIPLHFEAKMKNYISAFILITVLSACKDATNAIKQAQ
jgi:hypothetical protein